MMKDTILRKHLVLGLLRFRQSIEVLYIYFSLKSMEAQILRVFLTLWKLCCCYFFWFCLKWKTLENPKPFPTVFLVDQHVQREIIINKKPFYLITEQSKVKALSIFVTIIMFQKTKRSKVCHSHKQNGFLTCLFRCCKLVWYNVCFILRGWFMRSITRMKRLNCIKTCCQEYSAVIKEYNISREKHGSLIIHISLCSNYITILHIDKSRGHAKQQQISATHQNNMQNWCRR